MKKLLMAAAIALTSSQAFATCEGVDLSALHQKMENVIAAGDHGKEHIKYNTDIVGKDRLCVAKLVDAHKKGEALQTIEADIAALFGMMGTAHIG